MSFKFTWTEDQIQLIGKKKVNDKKVKKNLLGDAVKLGIFVLRKGRALPAGTRRKRSDGYTYEKQSDGTWSKVTEKKEKKEKLTGQQVEMKGKISDINKLGSENKDEYLSFHTPVLQIAYDLGQKGIDLSKQPVVTGYRYGKAPNSFISQNYRDQTSEFGLSMAAIEGGKEVGSSVWFSGKKYKYSGILLPYKGSDGENLILALDAENWGD